MTITFAIDHEYEGGHLVSFDTETETFSHNWLKRFHLDGRRSYLTFFTFDPFTGKKIDLNYLRKFL